jgi:hypothetical protein
MKQNIIITFILGIFLGAILIYFLCDGKDESEDESEDFNSSNDLPTGFYTDQNKCRYTCENTRCSMDKPSGYCRPDTGSCISGVCKLPCGTNTNTQSVTGYCNNSGYVCDDGLCAPECTPANLNGKCSDPLKTCDQTGQCKLTCGNGTQGLTSLTGVCSDSERNLIPGQTCVNGSCKRICGTGSNGTSPTGYCPTGSCDNGTCKPDCGTGSNGTSPTGYCPTGNSCIGGNCITTYSCEVSCGEKRAPG